MKTKTIQRLALLAWALAVIISGCGLREASNRRAEMKAEAAIAPDRFRYSEPDGLIFRVRLITDTTTHREYMVVETTHGVAITPILNTF